MRPILQLSHIASLGTIALLLLMVACGTAAPATPSASQAEPPVDTSATAVPTANPTPMLESSSAVAVNPGKLTWMTGGWGNERFTYNYGVGGGNNYGRILHGFLIATNEKTELLPGIATDWQISEDGLTWTFTIREGVKFHDGSNLTAEDVWWTWMHYWGKDESGSALERATQSSAQAQARIVERIEQPAPDQVSITVTQGDGGFPAAMVSEAAANWYGVVPQRPKVHDDLQESAYDRNPIAAGPMRLVNHVQAEVMQFERFDEYYYQPDNGVPEDRRVKFTTLDLHLIPEEATRVAAIRSGEADIAPASLATKDQVEAGGGRLVFGPEGIYVRVMLMGCFKAEFPCHDKRVRQALDYAVDKEVLRDQLFGGPEVFQVKGWAHITPSTIGYSPELDPWSFDPDKARQLLADAGYPGGEGFGKLIVNTWVSTAMPFLPESAQVAADSWRNELGLDVEVRVGDEAALKAATLSGDLHGQVLWRDNEASLDKSSLYRSSYASPEHGSRLHNDPELFALAQQTLAVTDPTKRDEAFNLLNKKAREESYELGIGYVNIPWAVGPRVTEWQPWPMSFYPSNLHGIVLK
jgi:peptide/nickel transport system substrate-binding protein